MIGKITTAASAFVLSAALLAGPAGAADQSAPDMTATVKDTKGEILGTVTFSATPSGITHIVANLEGVPEGKHGFHIHETGECDPADGFKSAGGHYTGGMEHGILAKGGPHAGDLPNVHVANDGIVAVEVFTATISTDANGSNPLADADGSAVMIHSGPDDYTSQPAGAAGDRIACGVIE
ncbi:superoxide dismutase family protein [Acuticoccus sp. MNP-M23]|uniref:superoxide dismutase family protein n=1 Tax=Acuticoccus sp. MNP-M23 TaxID=3072793 RepID=UPI002815A16B|nr:superoxide dismutase family protein [Acuticoccus sp. MNP-M23]WMS44886.1 superoxide dismutase family protein [Acuticoccus sp. MNP-M23]